MPHDPLTGLDALVDIVTAKPKPKAKGLSGYFTSQIETRPTFSLT